MFDSFVNPWSMAAGTLLVSVPIIIHLINRLRFKRVRWAAMEFLLKAQKRMKRKLIIQQLILLLLRCLMVFLIAVLVGRYYGLSAFQGRESRNTVHLVLLDDSPSMGDREDAANQTDAFASAKVAVVDQIAQAASLATNPQMLEVMLLSDQANVQKFDRINQTTIAKAKADLNKYQATPARGNLPEALKKAKAIADADGPDTARVVHVISDFRGTDWEQDGPALRTAIEDLTRQGVRVHLVDVAMPYRKDEKRPPLFHDNVGIVEFSPSRKVVPRFEQTEFTLRVKNFGAAEMKDLRFAISVNGDDNKGLSVAIPTLPGNQEEQIRFRLMLDRAGTAEKPLERFSLVTARLETPEPGGLSVDNVRHAVVEVRDKLPILAIDGRPSERDKKEGDSFYLRNIFTNVSGGYAWQPGTVKDLENLELKNFSCILLMNVPAVSEPAAKKLEEYVRGGGGLGIFLGPDVKPMDYNSVLYADGQGVLPAPLPEKPVEPMPEEKVFEKLFNFQKKILLRDKAMMRHDALFNIYFNERGKEDKENSQGLEKFYNFVLVKQYWPIKRLGKWRDDPSVKELYCLPNDAAMGQYEPAAVALMNKLPAEEPKYAKYKDVLTALKSDIRRVASSTEALFKLAAVLDRLLADQISEGDATEALLREFWGLPENADLKAEAVRLRDAVKYGDPLYMVKTFGKGRVSLMTTTAGEQWTDWPGGPGGRSYAPVMSEMERYLSGGGSDESPSVGSPLTLAVDAAQYKPLVGRAFLTVDYSAKSAENARVANIQDLKEQPLVTEKGQAKLNFAEAGQPGAYIFTLTRLKGTGAETTETPEYVAFACNVDPRESDLRRAARDDIQQQAPGAGLHSFGDTTWLDELKNKRTDLTEGGWIFLLLLLILVAEQALAVKLSYHTAQAQHLDAAPSVAAAFEKSTAANPVVRDPT